MTPHKINVKPGAMVKYVEMNRKTIAPKKALNKPTNRQVEENASKFIRS